MVARARHRSRLRRKSPAAGWGLSAFSLLLAAIFAVGAFPGLPSRAVAESSPVLLPDTEQRTLVAKNGEEYRIFIAHPKAPAPAAGYPILYALDGNAVIPLLSSLLRSHVGRDDLSGFEPGIVVAIGYPTDRPLDMRRRSMDYTPAQATPTTGTYLKPEGTGGADRFLDFIENELKPLIERDFRVDRGRQAIFGHSFGGLFVLHTLFTLPQAFQSYIAASPSIWWADRAILQTERSFAMRNEPLDGRRLFVMVGGYEQALGPRLERARDAKEIAGRLKDRRMVDEARGLADRMSALKERGLQVAFEEIPGETHGSVIPFAVVKGFRFAFGSRP